MQSVCDHLSTFYFTQNTFYGIICCISYFNHNLLYLKASLRVVFVTITSEVAESVAGPVCVLQNSFLKTVHLRNCEHCSSTTRQCGLWRYVLCSYIPSACSHPAAPSPLTLCALGLRYLVFEIRLQGDHQSYLARPSFRKLTVWRNSLWVKMLELGVRGKMWRVIKEMYRVSRSAVLVDGECSKALMRSKV